MSVVRRWSAALAALAAVLTFVAALAGVAAAAKPGSSGAVVNFRTGGIFSCTAGVVGGTTVPTDTANITATTTTIKAELTLTSVPNGTAFSGTLWQTGCVKSKNFRDTVSGRAVTVTDNRVTNGAFVIITFATGKQEITPLVSFAGTAH